MFFIYDLEEEWFIKKLCTMVFNQKEFWYSIHVESLIDHGVFLSSLTLMYICILIYKINPSARKENFQII